MRVLMVCLGNICRSPIAEGVLHHKAKQAGLNWIVDSAGISAFHTGEKPHRHSIKICSKHGIDISGQKARQFSVDDFVNFDKIYAMSYDVYSEILHHAKGEIDSDKVDLFLNELEEGCNDSVPDPWYGDEEGYAPVFEMIEKTCEQIVKRYS